MSLPERYQAFSRRNSSRRVRRDRRFGCALLHRIYSEENSSRSSTNRLRSAKTCSRSTTVAVRLLIVSTRSPNLSGRSPMTRIRSSMTRFRSSMKATRSSILLYLVLAAAISGPILAFASSYSDGGPSFFYSTGIANRTLGSMILGWSVSFLQRSNRDVIETADELEGGSAWPAFSDPAAFQPSFNRHQNWQYAPIC